MYSLMIGLTYFLAKLAQLAWEENDGFGWDECMNKPLLGEFRYSDGYIEKVYTQERYNLLMKVPDVHLVKKFG